MGSHSSQSSQEQITLAVIEYLRDRYPGYVKRKELFLHCKQTILDCPSEDNWVTQFKRAQRFHPHIFQHGHLKGYYRLAPAPKAWPDAFDRARKLLDSLSDSVVGTSMIPLAEVEFIHELLDHAEDAIPNEHVYPGTTQHYVI